MSALQEAVESVLANPAMRAPLFKFWGLKCDFFNATDAPAEGHFLDRQDTSSRTYDLAADPDGRIQVLLMPLYAFTGIRKWTQNPDPGGEYFMYPRKVPKTLLSGAVCRFKFPKSGRDRFYYWRIGEPLKIEGIKKTIIQKFQIEPYRYG